MLVICRNVCCGVWGETQIGRRGEVSEVSNAGSSEAARHGANRARLFP